MNIQSTIVAFKVVAFALATAILAPNIAKLTHAFNHNTHVVCDADDNNETHFHKSDSDCDFYKFKLNKNYHFKLNLPNLQLITFNNRNIHLNYELLSDDKPLHILLRGPPIA